MPRRSKRRKGASTVGPQAKTARKLLIRQRKPRSLDSEGNEKPISEYYEAMKRFQKFTGSEIKDRSDGDDKILDNMVERLCKGETIENTEKHPNLFFDVIFRSDFLQIKSDLIETFYCQLWNSFMFNQSLHHIVANLDRLDYISHVKTYIAAAFFKIFNIAARLWFDNFVVLEYTQVSFWQDLDWKELDQLEILLCAFTSLCSNDKFDFIYINMLFKLFQLKGIILHNCNLDNCNTDVLFEGLELQFLKLSKCGTSVNNIIQRYYSDSLKNLIHLDISRNLLHNKTLKKIRLIPLKSLIISDSIKHICYYRGGKCSEGNIDLLWDKGCLKETIEKLDVSYNKITTKNLEKIFQLKLIELDVTKTMGTVEFSQFIGCRRTNTLKVLKAGKNKMYFDEFKALCGLKLEALEFDYYGSPNEDFLSLSHYPLINHLTRLKLALNDPPREFISFISKFKLTHLECELNNSPNFDSFFLDYPEERKHLVNVKMKFINGPTCNINAIIKGLEDVEYLRINSAQLNVTHP